MEQPLADNRSIGAFSTPPDEGSTRGGSFSSCVFNAESLVFESGVFSILDDPTR